MQTHTLHHGLHCTLAHSSAVAGSNISRDCVDVENWNIKYERKMQLFIKGTSHRPWTLNNTFCGFSAIIAAATTIMQIQDRYNLKYHWSLPYLTNYSSSMVGFIALKAVLSLSIAKWHTHFDIPSFILLSPVLRMTVRRVWWYNKIGHDVHSIGSRLSGLSEIVLRAQ